jgi:hypothetical protein
MAPVLRGRRRKFLRNVKVSLPGARLKAIFKTIL